MLLKPVEQLRPDEIRFMQQRLADWPQLQHYRDANARLPAAAGPATLGLRRLHHRRLGQEGSAAFFPARAGSPRYQRPDHGTDAGALPAGRAGAEATGGGDPGRYQRYCRQHRSIHAGDDRKTTCTRWWTWPAHMASPWCWHRCCRSAITHGCPGSRLRQGACAEHGVEAPCRCTAAGLSDYHTPMAMPPADSIAAGRGWRASYGGAMR